MEHFISFKLIILGHRDFKTRSQSEKGLQCLKKHLLFLFEKEPPGTESQETGISRGNIRRNIRMTMVLTQ